MGPLRVVAPKPYFSAANQREVEMASALTDSERRRLEDERSERLIKACDDSDKAGYSTKAFRASLAENGPVEAVSRVITSDPKASGFAALASLAPFDDSLGRFPTLRGLCLRAQEVGAHRRGDCAQRTVEGSLRRPAAGSGKEATNSKSAAGPRQSLVSLGSWSGAGVGLVVGFQQVRAVDLSVALGGREARVTEQLLDSA